MSDTHGRLSRMRGLLHGPGHDRAWRSLLTMLRTWRGGDVQVGIEYALGHLDNWPDDVRQAEPKWVTKVLSGGEVPTEWPLVRTIRTMGGKTGLRGLEALANAPEMSSIARLELTNYGFGDEAIPLLTNSPHLSGLRYLSLKKNRVTDQGLRAFISPPHLSDSIEIDLRDNPIDIMRLLQVEDPSPRIIRIDPDVKIYRLTLEELERICQCPLLRWSYELDLSRNPLGNRALDVLARSSYLKDLQRLVMTRCSLGEGRAGTALSRLLAHCPLKVLDLSNNVIGPKSLQALRASPHLTTLTMLNLNDNPIGDTGVRALAEAEHLTGLSHLNLRGCWLTEEGVRALAQSPRMQSLSRLDLGQNDITNEGAKALARSEFLTNLSMLSLRSNSISDEGVLALLDSPHLKKLKGLALGVSSRLSQHVARRVRARFGPKDPAAWLDEELPPL